MKLTAFVAAVVLMGAFSMPVLAQSGADGAGVAVRAGAPTDYLEGFSDKSPPSADSRERGLLRVTAYADALAKRDFASAYGMLRLSYQAANPRVDWEIGLKNRGDLWATGKLQILRSSWMRDPAGQPSGAYVVYDFQGHRTNGDFDCGYIVLHQPTENSEFSVVRTDANYVASEFMVDGKPNAEVAGQLPCFMGEIVAAKR